MRALVLSNSELDERNINNNLETLQGIVGGYIETPFISRTFANNNIIAIINEEGKLKGLRPEIAIVDNGKIIDIIVGNVIFVSSDGEDFTGLSNKQINIIKKSFGGAIYGEYVIGVLSI